MYRAYAPEDVDIAVGSFNIDGWISASTKKSSDNTTEFIGIDGRVGMTYTEDRTGVFELEVLQQNNSVNRMCAAWQQAQDANKTPIFANITINDKSGGHLVFLRDCHLKSPADQDLSTEGGSRTWTFFVSRLNYSTEIDGTGGISEEESLATLRKLLNTASNR